MNLWQLAVISGFLQVSYLFVQVRSWYATRLHGASDQDRQHSGAQSGERPGSHPDQ